MRTHRNRFVPAAHRWPSVAIFLIATALHVPGTVAIAQLVGDSVLPVGTRVRIATVNRDHAIGSRRAIGVVQARSADTIVVAWDNGLRSTLRDSEISRIDVSAGPQPYVLRGMGFGLLLGATAGGVIGAATYEPSAFLDFGIGANIAAGAVVLGAAGTVIGGLVGGVTRREGWSPLQLSGEAQRFRVEPLFSARSRGVKVVLRF